MLLIFYCNQTRIVFLLADLTKYVIIVGKVNPGLVAVKIDALR